MMVINKALIVVVRLSMPGLAFIFHMAFIEPASAAITPAKIMAINLNTKVL